MGTRKKTPVVGDAAADLLADPPGESDAGTASNAVRKPEETPEEKPKRGRPPGAKNKNRSHHKKNKPAPTREMCEIAARRFVGYLAMGAVFANGGRDRAEPDAKVGEKAGQGRLLALPTEKEAADLSVAYADCFEQYGIPYCPAWLFALGVTGLFAHRTYQLPGTQDRIREWKDRRIAAREAKRGAHPDTGFDRNGKGPLGEGDSPEAR